MYKNADGTPMLHVMKECPRHYFLSYMVYRDWPLLYRFNKLMLRLSEGGFALLWYQQTEQAFLMESAIHRQLEESKIRKPFSLSDIQAPFYFLVFGYAVSFVVFLLEKFILYPENVERIWEFVNPVGSYFRNFELNRARSFRRKKQKPKNNGQKFRNV